MYKKDEQTRFPIPSTEEQKFPRTLASTQKTQKSFNPKNPESFNPKRQSNKTQKTIKKKHKKNQTKSEIELKQQEKKKEREKEEKITNYRRNRSEIETQFETQASNLRHRLKPPSQTQVAEAAVLPIEGFEEEEKKRERESSDLAGLHHHRSDRPPPPPNRTSLHHQRRPPPPSLPLSPAMNQTETTSSSASFRFLFSEQPTSAASSWYYEWIRTDKQLHLKRAARHNCLIFGGHSMRNPPLLTMLETFCMISLISMLFVSLLLKWLYNHKTSTKNHPPSPLKLPVIGNLHQLGNLAHRSLRSLAQKHGPIMLLHFGRTPTLVISSAKAASEIMKAQDITFADRPVRKFVKKLMYNGKGVAFLPYGELWRQMKSIYMLQLLNNKKVESFRRVREEEVSLLMKNIEQLSSESLPVNLSEMLGSLTNNVISRAAFSRRHGEGENGVKFKQLLRDYLRLLGRFHVGDYIPFLSWVSRFNRSEAEVERVARDIDEFLESVIKERIEGQVEDEDREDFLDILLKIYKGETAGASIDRDSMKSLILIAFSAGTDTTSTTLEWTMAELLRHPRVMKKLQSEVRAVLRGKQEITDEDLEKMLYMKAVIKEAFRFHPALPLLPRVAREDAKVMGYDIAARTVVIINTWAIGRDPALWDEPEAFRPERFLNSTIDAKGLDFELLPFGAGRRGCPGISFSMAVLELLLASLVQKFDWELPMAGATAKEEEELDMSEAPGVSVRKRIPLLVIATPSSCP